MQKQLAWIEPGNWLGIFGGGQLGRMFTHAAQARGYHVTVFESEVACPAAQAADRHLCPADDQVNVHDLIETFAQNCAAVTLEFENVPADWIRVAGRHTRTRPGSDFLELCQNRVREKSSLQAAGFPVTPFRPVKSVEELYAAASELGWPLIVKTSRSGYDGKGQVVIPKEAEAAGAWSTLGDEDCIAEMRIDFVAEVSMLGARNARGEIVTYPLIENSHSRHILDVSRCPVRSELERFESAAREIVIGIATNFQVEGLFCVEFFVDACRGLLVNEIAPRPHNSGHLTIEAFPSSQFDQQLRALCNLPLASTKDFRPAAMANLLGDLWFDSNDDSANASAANTPLEANLLQTSLTQTSLTLARPLESIPPTALSQGAHASSTARPHRLCWERLFEAEQTYLHLYGKAQPRIGRKMGHLTCTADTAEEAVERVLRLREALRY